MQDTLIFHETISRLRNFFINHKKYIEVPTQSRTSILAACEDPETITPYSINGKIFPLPQTGQMWLEKELLENPKYPGVVCQTTSYRDEPNIIEGRHLRIFPMFEFESHGGMQDLINLEVELLDNLGFKEKPVILNYQEICDKYQVKTLEAEHETRMQEEYGNIILLTYFNKASQPFWNMKQVSDNEYAKVDVILYGQETIGSAERSCNRDEMLKNFYSVSDGKYAQKLFDSFTKERVMKEMDEYLDLSFFNRFGAGIGVSRMARALSLAEIV